MKVLVTGGAGYIGSHIIVELLDQTSWEVISIDNFCNSSPETFDRIKQITRREVRNVNIDLQDAGATADFFAEHSPIESIIHLAALKSVSESISNPLKYYKNNINSLIHILEGALRQGCKHFVFSSSCTVYGAIDTLPVDENTPIKSPTSAYGATKQIGERLIEDCVRNYPSINAISLRYFNPVGAHPTGLLGEKPKKNAENLLPVITETAAGIRKKMTVYGKDYKTRDGSCIRDYVHVKDIANAHINALQYLRESPEGHYDVINLGSSKGVSVIEMIHAFEQATGVRLNYEFGKRRAGDVEAIYSNCEKARKLLGWKACYGVEEMMLTAWKWQKHITEAQ